jgi:hypothetical protein
MICQYVVSSDRVGTTYSYTVFVGCVRAIAELANIEQPQHHAGGRLITSRYGVGYMTRDLFGVWTLCNVWGHRVAPRGMSRTGLGSEDEVGSLGYV